MIIQKALSLGITQLKDLDIPNPQLDAKILLKFLLGYTSEVFELKRNEEINDNYIKNYLKLIKRRSNREPIAHIVEKKSFWKNDFKVSKATLIPRPETELIIENVLKYFPNKSSNLNIIDLGTGTGCIIISLIQEYVNATGIGIDISQSAIDIANINKQILRNPEKLDFFKADFKDYDLDKFDIIVTNPPYVSHEDKEKNLQHDILHYEPHIALFADNNGLNCYEKIFNNITLCKKNNCYMFIEVGIGQSQEVSNLLKYNEFNIVSIENDLANIPRCIVAKK